MRHEALEQRKATIEARYTELKNNIEKETEEMRRLEGEHRLILDLLQEPEPQVAKPKRMRKVVEEDAPTE